MAQDIKFSNVMSAIAFFIMGLAVHAAIVAPKTEGLIASCIISVVGAVVGLAYLYEGGH